MQTLAPWLAERGVFVQGPVVLWTKRLPAGGGYRGGVGSWDQIRKNLSPLLADGDAWVTTLPDFYGLPEDLPGFAAHKGHGPAHEQVASVQGELAVAFGHQPRFLPFLALHEFEAWMFAAPAVVSAHFGSPAIAAKVAAERRFRQANGPRVMVCTAAGREGINLQFARVLFNFDLPWNPMDVEQRIGRIHRYGQNHTAQVYNLVLSDTIEGRIFLLLEDKLTEIAKAVGRVDAQGNVAEDMRAQILGHLSERLNYDKLYQQALSDPELKRTELELEAALSNSPTRARRGKWCSTYSRISTGSAWMTTSHWPM